MNKYSAILRTLSDAPDSQIEASICGMLKQLADADEVKADQLQDILNVCAHASLASDFAMVAMDHVWQQMLKDEGRNLADAIMEGRNKHG